MLQIEAFNDFWLDCNTTILYSILLSTKAVDKAYIYNNGYEYKLLEEDVQDTNEIFVSICSTADTSILKNRMLKNEQEVNLYSQSCPIAAIKEILDQERIILLRVDLFYWIDDNHHYGNTHLDHYSLVKGYDEERKCLIVFETGIKGYCEYLISYDKAVEAICAAHATSLVYDIDYELEEIMYTKQDIVRNAEIIISSIDYVCSNQEYILCVSEMSEDGIRDVYDVLQTHLFGMQNREKVNRHLFMISFENEVINGYSFCKEFERLEGQFEILKGICIKNQLKKNNWEVLECLKNKMILLLREEREIWKKFLAIQGEMKLRVGR